MKREQQILALGDGNFSFSLALATLLQSNNSIAFDYLGIQTTDFHLACTSFDSKEEVLTKYPESVQILHKLHQNDHVTVMHDINAWELKRQFGDQKFDVVYWNHPHLGTENFKMHRFLMAHFLASAIGQLNSGGSIIISLVQGQETRWNLISADSIPQRLGLSVVSQQPFVEDQYDGYICKRNKNGQSFKNNHTRTHVGTMMQSFTYRFVVTESPLQLEFDHLTIDNDGQPRLKVEHVVKSIMMYDPVAHKKRKDLESKEFDWQCPACDRVCPSLRSIGSHYHAMHELQLEQVVTTRDFKCHCGKQFKRDRDLKAHQASLHIRLSERAVQTLGIQQQVQDDYQYVPCDICGQAVMVTKDSEDGMLVHLESLKPVVCMQMKCPLCSSSKRFMDHRALEQHYRSCLYQQSQSSSNE